MMSKFYNTIWEHNCDMVFYYLKENLICRWYDIMKMNLQMLHWWVI